MRRSLSIILLLLGALSSQATTIVVNSADQLKQVEAVAGDTVVLAAGLWTDAVLSFEARGTSDIPVVLRGQEAGKTIITGHCSLSFSGEYIVVEDLWFKNPQSIKPKAPIVQFRTSSSLHASNCTLRNCRITGDGLGLDMYDSRWVFLYGQNNIVEFCSFEDKGSMGVLLEVILTPDRYSHTGHIIRNNYFTRPRSLLNEKGRPHNGQETIRIGLSSSSMSSGGCLVENNYFYRCNGEGEIVSSKSCDNVFRSNLFVECVGMLTLRHGNRAVVENNYFDGGNIAETGGIRIIGENNVVRNNVMYRLAGKNMSAAICIMKGITNSELYEYYQVVNAVVEGNVAIGCHQGMSINYGTRERQVEPVRDSKISDNLFVNCTIGAELFDNPSVENVKWDNNRFNGGKFVGCSIDQIGGQRTREVRAFKLPEIVAGAKWKINN